MRFSCGWLSFAYPKVVFKNVVVWLDHLLATVLLFSLAYGFSFFLHLLTVTGIRLYKYVEVRLSMFQYVASKLVLS